MEYRLDNIDLIYDLMTSLFEFDDVTGAVLGTVAMGMYIAGCMIIAIKLEKFITY